MGSNARAPGKAGLGLGLALAAASVAGGLESPADGAGPSVLAVVAKAGIGRSGGDEASDDLLIEGEKRIVITLKKANSGLYSVIFNFI